MTQKYGFNPTFYQNNTDDVVIDFLVHLNNHANIILNSDQYEQLETLLRNKQFSQADRTLQQFITRNDFQDILEGLSKQYLPGEYDSLSMVELKEKLKPLLPPYTHRKDLHDALLRNDTKTLKKSYKIQ